MPDKICIFIVSKVVDFSKYIVQAMSKWNINGASLRFASLQVSHQRALQSTHMRSLYSTRMVD